MSKLRIGFVGVGGMGQCAHLRNYASLPDCEVVAIAEVRGDLGRKVAARYGIPRVYADHSELLANEQLDGLVSSQPFTRHGTLLPELLKARLPLFTEKPLAGSIEQGEKVLKAALDAGTWHMVGYHKRSDPATMYAKDTIDRLKQSGEVGKLRYVRILMPAGDWVASGFADLVRSDEPGPPLPGDPPAPDMSADDYNEYVAFVNYYIHQVNLLRHLLGEPYSVTYVDPQKVVLVAESVSGATGVIEMSPYVTTVDWQESALVAFERGTVKLDLPAPLASNRPGRVEVMLDPGDGVTPTTSVPTLPWVHAMKQQAANFCAAIRGERPPMCDSAEALEDLRVARQYLRLATGR